MVVRFHRLMYKAYTRVLQLLGMTGEDFFAGTPFSSSLTSAHPPPTLSNSLYKRIRKEYN